MHAEKLIWVSNFALQGHIGTSSWGLEMLQEREIIPDVIKLAEECGVFSMRGLVLLLIYLFLNVQFN